MIKPSVSLESGKYWLDNVEPFLMLNPAWTLRHAEAFVPFLFPEGCPGFCNNNGRCTLEASGWHCICQPGWRGAGCHVAMETLCTDSKDNEGGMSVHRNRHELIVQTPSQPRAPLFCCISAVSLVVLHQEKKWLQTFDRVQAESQPFFQFTSVSCQESASCLSDGLVDCLDPDCCLQPSCQNHLYCRGSPDPVEVLSQSPASLDPQRVRRGRMSVFAAWFDTKTASNTVPPCLP